MSSVPPRAPDTWGAEEWDLLGDLSPLGGLPPLEVPSARDVPMDAVAAAAATAAAIDDLVADLNPPQREAVLHDGGPARRRRRRRLGQDPGAHAADRPARRLGCAALAHPRHHLHEQGRRRDAPSRRRARRPGRREDVDLDLPLRLREDAAPQRRADRVSPRVHDLRRRRLPPARGARPRRPRHRPAAIPPAGGARRHQLRPSRT